MQDKTIAYSLFAIIGIVVISGLVIFISESMTGMGLYSGSLRIEEDPYPHARGRTVQGGVQEVPGYDMPVPVAESPEAYEYTGYGIFKRRYPGRIHTTLTSCAGQARYQPKYKGYTEELSLTEAMDIHGHLMEENCLPAPHFEGKYCCKWKGTGQRVY